jgi:hypothetical protein
MGAQTIREVIIKIGLESDSRGYRPPDFRKVQAEADAAKKSVDALAASVSKVGKGGLGGTGPGGSKGGGGKPQASPFFGDANIGVGKYGNQFGRQDRFNQQIFGGDDLVLRRSETLARVTERQAILEKESLQRQRLLMEVEGQRLEAINGLAMGALKLGRGIAFVTAASTEEYQAMLKYIAAAQGAFDIVSGTIDITKNLINFRKAATAATLAQAGAETALATASARSAAMNATSLIAGRAGLARGVTGAASVGAGAGTAVGLGAAALAATGGYALYEGLTAPGRAMRANDRRAAERGIRSDQDIDQSLSKVDRYIEGFSSRRDRSETTRESGIRTGRLNWRDALGQIDQESRVAREMLTLGQDQGDASTSPVEKAKRATASSDILLKNEQERMRILEGTEGALRRQWDTAQGLLRTTQETLRAEKDRYSSMEEQFGRLKPEQQARLRGIAEKKSRGEELSRSDIETLDRSGAGGGATVSAYFRGKGREGGFEAFAGAFGENAGLQQAQQAAKNASEVAKQSNEELTSVISEIGRDRKDTDQRIVKLLEDSYKLDDDLRARLDALEQSRREDNAGQVKAKGAGGYAPVPGRPF